MSHSLVILKSPTARCLAFHDAFLGVTGSGFAAAMWGFRMLLPLAVESWWCETSALTGCRGHPRHFVLEKATDVVDKFKAVVALRWFKVGME